MIRLSIVLSLFCFKLSLHHAFEARPSQTFLASLATFPRTCCSHPIALSSKSNHDSDNVEDDDEDDECTPSYVNRSAAWTKKYHTLLPDEKARASVMQLGLRSKEEWDEYVADGKIYHGPYLPNYPDEMYAQDWVSWEEFLGITRTYNESKALLRDVLKLENEEEYTNFIVMDSQRAAGLRLPFKPNIVYANSEWISWKDYLGIDYS